MLDCGDILDITQIKDWHANAVKVLTTETDDVTIDVSSLQKIDTCGIQVLLAIVMYVKSRGKQVIWSELSPAFINSASVLGLQHKLGMTLQ
jgi:anti-anti-sigma regulatory factor